MKNQFEEHIRQSLENYEVNYDPAHWRKMQSRLDKTNAGKSASAGKIMGLAAGILAVAGLVYYFGSENTTAEKPTVQHTFLNTQSNKNSVQQVESNDQAPEAGSRKPEANNNSNKKKVSATNNSAEEKSAATEKTEPLVENKTSSQEQTQPPPLQRSHWTPLSERTLLEESPFGPAVLKSSFHADVNSVCEGGAVQFTADNSDVPCTYKWYFGDGKTSAEQNPKHIYAQAGTYSVKLRVTSLKDKKSDEQKSTLTVLPVPSVRMNYVVSDDNNLLLKFDADAGKSTEWKWDFGDRQTSSEQNPVHAYSKKGNYKVVVTAKNSSGCISSVTKEVNVQREINLLAPTGFSPNGDGINDTWMPVALLSGEYVFTLSIYDKSNNVIFTTSDKNRPWDGQNVKTGDTFIWKAVVKDKNGEEFNYKGVITIAE